MANKKHLQRTSSRRASRRSAKTHQLKRASRLFLPWPIFIFLLLAAGVLLIKLTFDASAIDYTVRAKVPASPPVEPAIIQSPADGSRFRTVPITVAGSCPRDSYVSIFRNNVYSGSSLCTSDGRFELPVDLFEGANELRAQVYNMTDDKGPQSAPVTVYYEPRPGGAPVQTVPLIIKSDFLLRGFAVGQKVKWTVEIAGGKAPYALSVDWGDGTSSLISREKAGKLTLEHIYNKPGGENGYYNIAIKATDSEGRQAFLQLFVLVLPRDGLLPIPGTTGSIPPGSFWNRDLLKFIWPAYAVVTLMAISFWLGEREELIQLRREMARKKRKT